VTIALVSGMNGMMDGMTFPRPGPASRRRTARAFLSRWRYYPGNLTIVVETGIQRLPCETAGFVC